MEKYISKELEIFKEQLRVKAIESFDRTLQGEYLQNRLENIREKSCGEFTKDEIILVNEYIDIIIANENERAKFLYNKGFEDCISLLKELCIL